MFDKDEYMKSINQAADYIRSEIGEMPDTCIVLGSGLGPFTEMVNTIKKIPYSDIPGFPVTTVIGHSGELILAEIEGKKIILMSGRFHYYEGNDMSVCTMYVRVLSVLGVQNLILTIAAGGILEGMKPADLMVIKDHISLFCESPLRGPNLDSFGARFIDQSFVYDRDYIFRLKSIASDLGINLHEGVYCYTKGPQYETPAEIRLIKSLGGGAVGMSTVPEAIVASHCGMKILALSCITNLAAGISKEPLNHEEVLENAAKASTNSCKLVYNFVKTL
ncbi:MAG: purine-nucleoside phosphorylase [Clostridiales bacterium]|nr:purine-nucleoside phosphorylase [Clostridiales bacterium]